MNQYDQNNKKVSFEDERGHDPSIQSMRRAFSYMEEAQQGLLNHLNISPFDQRLRCAREKALELFERTWPLAVRQGIVANEKDAAPLYLHCLAGAFSSIGVQVSREFLPEDEKIILFLKEIGS
jgi:hypothetical protein